MAFQQFLAPERKTSSGVYLDNLTGVRALAVLWVLVFHTWGIAGGPSVTLPLPGLHRELALTPIIAMGGWGVDIFFVLSGFLLAPPLMKAAARLDRAAIAHFYRRRVLRILPAYLMALLALIYGLLFGLGPLPTPLEMVQDALLVNMWLGTPPLRGAFWSLPVEATFYLVLPLLVLAAWRIRSFVAVFVALVALAIVFRWVVVDTGAIRTPWVYMASFFVGRMDQFAIGALCAYACQRRPASARAGSVLLLAGLLALLAFAAFIAARGNMIDRADPVYSVFQSIIALLAAVILYGAASASRLARALLGNRAMVFIGTISYSLYLWHTIVLDIYALTDIAHATPAAGRLLAVTLYTWPPILLISFFSYLFVERPFLKIRHDPNGPERSLVQRHPVGLLVAAALALGVLTALARLTQQVIR